MSSRTQTTPQSRRTNTATTGGIPTRCIPTTRKAPGGDLYWDGTGTGNEWHETGTLVTFPADLLRGPTASATAPKDATSTNN